MKPDMSEVAKQRDQPNEKLGAEGFLGHADSDGQLEQRSTDIENGQESPPQEKEEQVRQITGFKVSDLATP